MATNYTNLLGFALPTTGELAGTWGQVVNDSITELVEDSIAGTATASVTGGDWTLSTTGSGASNEARCAILIPTGSPGVSRNIIAPSSSKAYIVDNQSNAAVVIKGSATTGVSIASGTAALVAWDGSDFVLVGQDLSNASGTLSVSKGGTGQTSLTANNVILGNGTSAVQFVAPGSSGNILTSNGTTWASTAPAPGGIKYTTEKTSNYTAVANDGVLTNTSGGAFTVTLPATPANGDQVFVADASGTWGTNNLTIGRNGSNIAGVAENLVCDISGAQVQLVYNSSGSNGWEVYAQVGGNGGTVVTLSGTQTLTNKTLTDPAIIGTILEDVYTISDGAAFEVDPGNGSIQLITLGASRTPKATNFAAGEAITLMVNDGSAYTITWTDATWGGSGVVWLTDGGAAPTLATTGYTAITLWKVSTQVYGARVGDNA